MRVLLRVYAYVKLKLDHDCNVSSIVWGKKTDKFWLRQFFNVDEDCNVKLVSIFFCLQILPVVFSNQSIMTYKWFLGLDSVGRYSTVLWLLLLRPNLNLLHVVVSSSGSFKHYVWVNLSNVFITHMLHILISTLHSHIIIHCSKKVTL